MDELQEQARVSTSQTVRAALYKEMQRIVHEDAPWVFVANWKQNAVTGCNVQNFRLEPSFFCSCTKLARTERSWGLHLRFDPHFYLQS